MLSAATEPEPATPSAPAVTPDSPPEPPGASEQPEDQAAPHRPEASTKHKPTPPRRVAAPVGFEVNLRNLGARGDGQPHPVREWVKAGKYKNLAAIQKEFPFVTSLDWSADEVAFQRALLDLPPEGGTIRIPAGRYVATAYGWRIDRDHVRLAGAGARNTMLSTGPALDEGLVLAPYRHVGWETGVDQELPFAADSGERDTDKLRLLDPARTADLKTGDLVFIRNGACRFDQDYGEFNEVASTTPEGDLVFKHPFARDYRLEFLNWANETAEPLTLPKAGKTVKVRVRTGDGFFALPSAGAITIGEQLLEIVRATEDSVVLRLPESAAAAAGTVLPAGTRIAKSRSVIRVTRTTRDFSAHGLRIFGRRKALNLSNSYEATFVDCDFVRRPDATTKPGGLTVDGDGGRFATFTRCSIRGTQPCAMQFARSFGDIGFDFCTFVATNVVFSEFCFNGRVEHCQLQTPPVLGSAVIVGRSCGNLRIEGNRIVVPAGEITVFDTTTDIQSQKLDAPGRLVIYGNTVVTATRPRLFLLRGGRDAEIAENTLNGVPRDPLPAPVAAP